MGEVNSDEASAVGAGVVVEERSGNFDGAEDFESTMIDSLVRSRYWLRTVMVPVAPLRTYEAGWHCCVKVDRAASVPGSTRIEFQTTRVSSSDASATGSWGGDRRRVRSASVAGSA